MPLRDYIEIQNLCDYFDLEGDTIQTLKQLYEEHFENLTFDVSDKETQLIMFLFDEIKNEDFNVFNIGCIYYYSTGVPSHETSELNSKHQTYINIINDMSDSIYFVLA